MTTKLSAANVKILDAYRKELKGYAARHTKYKTTPAVIALKPNEPVYGRGAPRIDRKTVESIEIDNVTSINQVYEFFKKYKDEPGLTLETEHNSNSECDCESAPISIIRITVTPNPLVDEMMKIWEEENDLFQILNQENIKKKKEAEVKAMKARIVSLEKELGWAGKQLKKIEKK